MELALVGEAVVLLCHREELMSQCLPLGRCTLACWRQTPLHTGGHLPEETSWGLSRNSDTWERIESSRESECQRDAGKPRERQIRIEGIVRNDSPWLSRKLCWPGLIKQVVDKNYWWTNSTSPVAVEAASDALSASWSPPSWSWLCPCSCPCT